jgi:hypothetical protein
VASLSQVVARLARCVMGSARYVAALPALSSSSSDYYNEGSTTVIFCRPATGDSSHFVTWIMFGPALSVAQDVLALCERDVLDVVVACGFVLGAIIWAEKAGVPAVGLVRMSPCPPAVLQLVRPHVSIARSNDQ